MLFGSENVCHGLASVSVSVEARKLKWWQQQSNEGMSLFLHRSIYLAIYLSQGVPRRA